ncbi:unnamed protein product [marine sediment metagenome]|uniref:Uncharacterized protein n=1 Tax=marine sediment metagenome TaxID=412755 RepID=X1BS87_9ZZZZ
MKSHKNDNIFLIDFHIIHCNDDCTLNFSIGPKRLVVKEVFYHMYIL